MNPRKQNMLRRDLHDRQKKKNEVKEKFSKKV
jgi:hypothetical protein